MNIVHHKESCVSTKCDVLVAGFFSDGEFPQPAAELDAAMDGELSRLRETGELGSGPADVTRILTPGGVAADQLLTVCLGPRESFARQQAFRAAGAASKAVSGRERTRVAWFLADGLTADVERSAVSGVLAGAAGQGLYRREPKLQPPDEMLWGGTHPEAIEAGRIEGEALNLARRLVNEPAGRLTPARFAEVAEEIGQETSLSVEVWDQDRLESERCGSLISVAQGSDEPPRLVILEHRPGKSKRPALALVGKGVTFDSGGLSLKPSDAMKTMKCDMAGAAAVLGAMQGIARLDLPIHVIGLCGLVENMVSGRSYKLGDVLEARNGKTIEVLNTDAEGRLVLADVLDVALERNPDRVIDLATLTGACVVALGNDISGLMTNDDAWCGFVKDAADAAGDLAWQLPMHEFFSEQIRSEVADIKNVGDGRWGGAITAAKFLEEFVDDRPWVHVDIAGPAFLDKPKPWIDAGGSGAFVPTLIEVARRLADS